MGEAVVPPVAGALVNQAAIPFIKQLGYAFEASENVKALDRATDRLWFRKEDVETEIGMDVQRGREVKKAVQHWMNRVKDVKVESDAIKERFNQRLCQCFSGCSLNCFSNYKISKDAYQKCSEVQVLCDEAFEALTFEPLPPASDNVKALRIATDKLSVKKEDVVRQVAREVQRGREVTKVVEQWMKRVEVIRKESDEIRERFDQRSCQCFNGCSENCFTNKISKDAYQKCLEVQVLFNEAEFEALTFEPLPPNVQRLPTTPTIPSIGNLNLELALEHIKDAGVGIIGIWGMGGVGKTHLLKDINNYFEKSSSFDRIIFVTVSRECSVEKIRADIARSLFSEQHINDDDSSLATKILNFLNKKKFLLLLDDLWERVNLVDIGIPDPFGSNQKVVLTTRISRVCGQMETQKKIKVHCLNKENAWRLFEDKVGVETIQFNPNIRYYAETLVRELDGLPLALIIIGRAMRGKNEIREWEHAIQLLQASRLSEIEECAKDDISLFKTLKFSYDSLKTDNLRRCFLACSLWPEDYEIEKTDLIQLWLGIGIVEELGKTDIYSPGYAHISDLLNTCLLEAGKNENYIKMHDVLRDMALWIVRDCDKNMNKWIIKGIGESDSSILLSNDTWCKAEYIVLRDYAGVLEIPSVISGTNLKTLIINNAHGGLETSGIQNYTGLTFLDLSRNGLKNVPEKICQLVNLRYLNLCTNNIKVLPVGFKFLANLRYLFLGFNRIKEIPSGVLSELKELIMLDLLQYPDDNFDIFPVIKDIESLEKIKALTINVSDNSELQRLSDLEHVLIRLLYINYEKDDNSHNSLLITSSFLGGVDRQRNLYGLFFNNCLGNKELVFQNSQRSFNWRFQNLTSLKFFNMPDLENIIYNGVVPENLFPRLRDLDIVYCNLKNFAWIMYLPCLELLNIKNGAHDQYVHELFSVEQTGSSESAEMEEVKNETPINQIFPSLHTMELSYLSHNVTSICAPHITFPSLKYLTVIDCSFVKLSFDRTTVTSNLKGIWGRRSWWDCLEWEDELLKSSLENLFTPF